MTTPTLDPDQLEDADSDLLTSSHATTSRRQLFALGATGAGVLGVSALGLPMGQAEAAGHGYGSATLHGGSKSSRSRGKYVTKLQKRLNELNNAGLKADGSFGPSTEKAVKAFQKKHKLTVDGRVGPATKKALASGKPAKKNYYKPNDNHKTSQSGAGAVITFTGGSKAMVNGTRVRFVWENLHRFGCIGKAPNHATLTLANLTGGIKKFQRKHGLAVDGVVGKKTWNKINSLKKGPKYPFDMDKWIAPTEKSAKGGSAKKRIKAMVTFFNRYKNKSPYTWGGMGYKGKTWAGFDCSGLVYQMVAAGGVLITSTNPVKHAQKDFRSTQAIYDDPKLRTYPMSKLKDGDIVTFSSSPSRTKAGICHDAIYYKGKLLESHSDGTKATPWKKGSDIHRHGYSRYVMPNVKRPFV